MKIIFIKSILLALCFAFTAQAEVIETNKYEDVLKYVTPDTLFVTDIDNTVVRPIQTLGSDQWVGATVTRLRKAGLQEEDSLHIAVGLFSLVQQQTKVVAIEPDIPKVLKKISAKGARTMGLTARNLGLQTATAAQLKSIGASLTGVKGKPNLNIENEKVGYISGVLFAGAHNDKGVILKRFLELNPMPNVKRIVFIDDKAHHTSEIDKAFAGSKYEVKAFRYGGADAIVKAYDPALAAKQWDGFIDENVLLPEPALAH